MINSKYIRVFYLPICIVAAPLLMGRLSRDLPLQGRHNVHNGVSSHQPSDCLRNHLFRPTWKKTSKLCVTGLCGGNSPATGEFPAQSLSNAENVSIWWRHHAERSNSCNIDLQTNVRNLTFILPFPLQRRAALLPWVRDWWVSPNQVDPYTWRIYLARIWKSISLFTAWFDAYD